MNVVLKGKHCTLTTLASVSTTVPVWDSDFSDVWPTVLTDDVSLILYGPHQRADSGPWTSPRG